MRKIIVLLVVFCLPSFAVALPVTIGNVTDEGNGVFSLSTGLTSTTDAQIEVFLGLSPGTLDGFVTGYLATQGSAIKDTVWLTAGETISFEWLWSSDEYAGSNAFPDFSFYSISTTAGGTSTTAGILADILGPNNTGGTYSWTNGAVAQWVTYGAGVMDARDNTVNSYLTVDTQAPEPATMLLFGTGLAGLAGSRLRKKK